MEFRRYSCPLIVGSYWRLPLVCVIPYRGPLNPTLGSDSMRTRYLRDYLRSDQPNPNTYVSQKASTFRPSFLISLPGETKP